MKHLFKAIATVLVLTAGIALPLQAQTVTVPFTFSGTSPVVLQMDTYGDLSSLGTYGTGTFSLTGAGTRMFWYPGKAAFRAGYVNGTQWNDANIGGYSVAFGWGTIASGDDSLAIGSSTLASNTNSVALGESTISSGYDSTAFGASSTATGGYGATAIGYRTLASGTAATSMNQITVASGNYSTAAGQQTAANSYASFTVGQFNLGLSQTGTTPSLTLWVSTDPLFEVGNGPGNGATPYADAFVVYKNGNAKFAGPVVIPQSGDIPMYTGN